jgi:hypothetical protein
MPEIWAKNGSLLRYKKVTQLTFKYIGVVSACDVAGNTVAQVVKTGAKKIPD